MGLNPKLEPQKTTTFIQFLSYKFFVKINELRVSFTIFEEILLQEKCKILQNNTML